MARVSASRAIKDSLAPETMMKALEMRFLSQMQTRHWVNWFSYN